MPSFLRSPSLKLLSRRNILTKEEFYEALDSLETGVSESDREILDRTFFRLESLCADRRVGLFIMLDKTGEDRERLYPCEGFIFFN